ncbi:MAG: aminoacyl-tRNA hydrolase [Parvularculaceae bacterium]|nr:aminoacyl-tRNA hydrolase [Parvularculaceae bacterium]
MFIFVGLGNPDAKYLGNRHNAGFMALDAIAEDRGMPPWRSKFQSLVTEGRLGGERVLLMKPQTYYNESGRAVGEAARFHKVSVDDIFVFHDEIDLAPGKLRVKKGGGLAGNNGLKSISAHLSPDVWRVRIGVGHPGRKDAVTHHVLKDFAKEERDGWFGDFLRYVGPASDHLLPPTEEGTNRFVAAILNPTGRKQQKPGTVAEDKAKTKPHLVSAPQPKTTSAMGDALRSLLPKKD